MGTSAGSIYIDLIIKNKLKAQTEKAAQQTANTVQKTMQKAGVNAGAAFRQTMAAALNRMQAKTAQTMAKAQQAMQSSMQKAAQSTTQSAKTMGQGFNKSLALARLKVKDLEQEFDALGAKMDAIVQKQAATSGQTPGDAAKSLQTNKAFQSLVKQQEALGRRLAAAQQRLTVEMQAEQAKQAAHAKATAEKAAAAQQKAQEKAIKSQQQAFQSLQSSAKSAYAKVGEAAKYVFAKLTKAVGNFSLGMKKSTGGVQSFGARLRSIVGGALIFNGISRALTSMTTYFKNAVMASGRFRDALANLKGAASTAAAPIVQALTPALTALANAAATVFSYVAKLFSLLTGKSVASMKASAAATNQYTNSVNGATDAAKELAEANNTLGIDELNVVQQNSKQDSSGGGSSGTVAPDYEFDGQSNLLDKMLESIKKGDWNQVGVLISQKLNETMAAINWPSIEKTARQWVDNAVNVLNSLVQNLNWSLVGDTFANGLNVALHCYDDFFQKFDWTSLGRGIGTGLNQMVTALDWKTVGRVLTDKLKAVLEMLHGFVATFDFASLGSSLADAIMAAINNVNWVQGIQDLSSLAVGFLVGLQNLIKGIDWAGIGATIYQMLASIDWGGLLLNLMNLIATAFTEGFTLLGGFLANAFTDLKTQLVSNFADTNSVVTQELATQFQWICQVIEDVINGFLMPLIGELQQIILDMLSGIQAAWDEYGAPILDAMGKAWESVRDIISSVYENVVKPVLEDFMVQLDWLWSKHLKPLWDNLMEFFGAFAEMVLAIWNEYLAPWIKNMVDVFGPVITTVVKYIMDSFSTAFAVVADIFNAMIEIFKGICKFITGVFTGDWGKAWEGIKDIFKGVWDGIVSLLKGSVNWIIDIVNTLIRAVNSALNLVIDKLNTLSFDIPDWVPVVGGQKFGFDIPKVTMSEIPKLANGGVITQPTLAMMGEYAGASTNPEIVAPESKIRGLLDESMAAMGENINRLVRLLEYHSSRTSTVNQPIEVKLDGQVLYRAMAQVEERQGVKIGGAFAYSY